MYFITFLLVLLTNSLLLTSAKSRHPFLPGILRTPNPALECSEWNNADTCVDCHTLRVCYRNDKGQFVSFAHSCKNLNSNKPHCDEYKCVEDSKKCENTETPAKCYDKDGYLPDPMDCTKYMHCLNWGGVTMQCPLGQSYKPNQYSIWPGSCENNYPCYNFTWDGLCSKNEYQIAVYPLDISIYGICLPDRMGGLQIAKCKIGYKYDMEENQCVPWCRHSEQMIKDYGNERRYYQCYYNGDGVLSWRIGFCAPDSVFVAIGDDGCCSGEGCAMPGYSRSDVLRLEIPSTTTTSTSPSTTSTTTSTTTTSTTPSTTTTSTTPSTTTTSTTPSTTTTSTTPSTTTTSTTPSTTTTSTTPSTTTSTASTTPKIIRPPQEPGRIPPFEHQSKLDRWQKFQDPYQPQQNQYQWFQNMY